MDFLLASHRAGRIFGIEVRLAYSLYIIMALMILPMLRAGWQPVLALMLLPVFVLLHELGHSLASLRLGVNVRGITLHVLGGAAEIYGLIPGPRSEIIISAMGPMVSFALATFFYALLYLTPFDIHFFLYYCLYTNLALGLFNLLPIFPMDGGRIALAIAIIKCGTQKALHYMRPISTVGVVLLGLYGVYNLINGDSSGVFVLVIAAWLYFKGGQEMQARIYAANYSAQNDAWLRNNNDNDPQWLKNAYGTQEESEKKMNVFSRWSLERKRKREASQQQKMQELNDKVDQVLQKVKEEGIANLTPQEKELLKKASQEYRNH